MIKPIIFGALATLSALPLVGCDSTSQTAITSAICTDASTLQASGLKLNAPQTTALQGIVTACASTAGGTSFNNATIALAIIQDAILLQSSGMLKDIHITALAPAQKLAVKKIDLDYAKAKAAGIVQ